MNRSEIKTGTRVMFQGRGGRAIYGTVKRVNRKTVTIEQCSDGPRGWRVYPWMLSPADSKDPGVGATTSPAGTRPWRKGDRVEFTDSRSGAKVVGTITRVNSKTCSVMPDGSEGGYYRVPPTMLRPAGAASGTAPAPKPDTTARDKAEWETYAPVYDLPEDAFGKEFTMRGDRFRIAGIKTRRPKYPVSIVRLRDGSRRKCSADAVRHALAVAALAPAPKRDEFTILDEICSTYSALSPENLTCDGELSRAQVARKRAGLNDRLRKLFAELGRTVSEGEAWTAYEKAMESV